MATPFILDINLRIKDILGLEKVKTALAGVGAGVSGKTGKGVPTQQLSLPTAIAFTGGTKGLDTISQQSQKASESLKKVSSEFSKTSKSAQSFAEQVGLAGRRYASFLAATVVPFALIGGFSKATASVVEFDNAMVKLDQILDQPRANLDALREQMLSLSRQTGTTLEDITKIAVTLAQAGKFAGGSAQGFKDFLEPLSKVPLLPTFEGVDQATEGVIAILGQFNNQGLKTADILDKIVKVSDRYAVSSADLIEGVKRGGGAFSAMGGTLDEFLSLMTVVKETTQESAASIGTSLRTIATRMTRPATVKFLEGLGITVRDANGDLLGLIKILEQVGVVFEQSNVEQKRAIGEALGGYRQIGRVFAALANYEKIGEVIGVSLGSSGAAAKSASKALESMGGQLKVLKAEFDVLIQTLAEPVFIPLIRGATEMGQALVSVLQFIKPVIPALATLIGFAAGFKTLELSIKGVAASAAYLTKIGVTGGAGGVPSIFGALGVGAGRATTQQRIQQRLATGYGGGVVAGGGFAAGAGKIFQSQLGQLAVLAGLNLAASKASDAFEKAGNSAGVLATETIRATTLMIGVASILSGKTVAGMASSLGILGSALGLGSIALTSFAYSAQKAADADFTKIIDAAQKKITDMDITIDPGDTEAFGKAIGEVGKTSTKAFLDGAAKFDPNASDKFFTNFTAFFAALSKRTGALLTGDIGKAFGTYTIGEDEARDVIKTIIGKNPEQLNQIISEAIRQFGLTGLEAGLEKSLMDFAGVSAPAAAELRRILIDTIGGFDGVRRLAEKIKNPMELLLSTTQKVAADLKDIYIPVELTHQLITLNDVISRTVKAIDANINSFDKLSSQIGQMDVPRFETDVPRTAAERIIREGRIEEVFDVSRFPDLAKAAEGTIQMGNALDLFFKSIIKGEDFARQLQTLADPQISPFDVVDEYINAFMESYPSEISPELEDQFRAQGRLLAQSIQEKLSEGGILLPQPEEIDKAFKAVFEKQAPFGDKVIELIEQYLEAQAKLIDVGTTAAVQRARIDVSTAVVPETIIDSMTRAFESVGIQLDRVSLQFGDVDQIIEALAQDSDLLTTILVKYESAIRDHAEKLRAADDAAKSGASNLRELQLSTDEAAKKVIDLRLGMDQLNKIMEMGPEAFRKIAEKYDRPIDTKYLEQTTEYMALLRQELTRQRQFIELQAATDISRIYEEPARIFANSLRESADAVVAFTRSLTLADIERGIAVPGAAEGVFKLSPKGEEAKFETRQLQSALFGGPIETVLETLFKNTMGELKSQTWKNVLWSPSPSKWSETFPQIDELKEVLSYYDIPGAINRIGLSSDQLDTIFRKTVDDLKGLSAEQGAREVDYIGAIHQDTQSLINNLKALIERPELAIRPEPLREALPQNIYDILRSLVLPTTGIQEPVTIPNLQNIEVSSTAIQTGGQNILTASETFREAINNMVAVSNVQREVNGRDVLPKDVVITDQQVAMSDNISELRSRLDDVVSAIDTQTQQEIELSQKEKIEPLNIAGLEENTNAIIENKTTTASVNDNLTGLSSELAKASEAMSTGINLDLETMSTIKVDVTGLSQAAREFTNEFEQVARNVVKEEIRVVLRQLASSAGNPETSSLFEGVLS